MSMEGLSIQCGFGKIAGKHQFQFNRGKYMLLRIVILWFFFSLWKSDLDDLLLTLLHDFHFSKIKNRAQTDPEPTGSD